MTPNICHYGHSTISLETTRYFFLFDWYEGKIEFPKDKQAVLIATHGHGDHFHPMIFEKAPENAIFILSDDIEATKNDAHWVHKDSEYTIADFKLWTFGSTDRGVSLVLETEDLHFYFAGDLNAWIWENDDKETQEKEKNDYLVELEKIKKHSVDVACVPIDPRLGPHAYAGIELFMDACRPKTVVPLHFQHDFSYIQTIHNDRPELPLLLFAAAGDCKSIH